MRASEVVTAFRLSDKNRLYLENLGFLDGRTGRKAKDSQNVSRFINECLTLCLEGGFHGKKDIVRTDQLYLAFAEMKAVTAARAWEEKGREWDEYKRRVAIQAAKAMENQRTL